LFVSPKEYREIADFYMIKHALEVGLMLALKAVFPHI